MGRERAAATAPGLPKDSRAAIGGDAPASAPAASANAIG